MSGNSIHVEYLLVIDSQGNFCSDIPSFKNLLLTNPEMSLEEDLIRHKNTAIKFKIQLEKMEEDKNAFHVHFIYDNMNNNLEEFEQFMSLINGIFYRISKNINTLRDDISLHYSELAYPKIHQVENLMRKLITKFMITNVGLNWTEKYVPNEVKNGRGNAKSDSNINYLYSLDFIQLSNILFKKYSPFTIDELFKKISNIKDGDSETKSSDLKKFIPISNWDRYFSGILNVEAAHLEKVWGEIYKIRNKVAHNNILEKKDYDEISRYVLEVNRILEQAVENLDKISVSDKDKEIISSNLVLEEKNTFENLMSDRHHFLRLHSSLDETLTKFILKRKSEDIQLDENEIIIMALFEKLNLIRSTELSKIIDFEALKDIRFINKYRNEVLHMPDEILSKEELASAIALSIDLLEYLNFLIVEKQ